MGSAGWWRIVDDWWICPLIVVEESQRILQSEQLKHLLKHFCIVLTDAAVSVHLFEEFVTFIDVLFCSLGNGTQTDHNLQLLLSNRATDLQQTTPEFITLAWLWLESRPSPVRKA